MSSTSTGPGPDPQARRAAAEVQRRMELGLAAVRGVTLAWGLVVVLVDASSGVLRRSGPAFVLLGVLAVWSAVWTVAVVRRDRWISGPAGVVDIVLASVTVALDQYVYAGDRSQSLASAWPLVAVLATGVAAGPGWGLAGGASVGVANAVAAAIDGGVDGRLLALGGATVLYSAAGWIAGWVAAQLRRTAQVAAAAEARADVARTLHDGVLQTLAVIGRRSDDPDLVALAREQDAELRAFLRTGAGAAGDEDQHGSADLAARLGPALVRLGSRHGIRARLVVVDVGTTTPAGAEALVAATGEVVVNAAKHAGVDEVWVSVDARMPSGTSVVVHDEGVGFDPATTAEGTGLAQSVRARLAVVGGGVQVRSAPGSGCEVTLWAP